MRKVKLTKAQLGMLDDCLGGNVEGHAHKVGKTYVEADREQFSYMGTVVRELTSSDEWLLEGHEFEPDSPQESFLLLQKNLCVSCLLDKLEEAAYGD